MKLEYNCLLGRPFKHGVTDCYSLIRDFYRINYGIELTDYARPDEWWNKGLNLYQDNILKEGFYLLDVHHSEWQPGDVLLMGIQSRVANHAAVLVENGHIIHHLWGRLSTKEPYRRFYRNLTLGVYRHKDVPDYREEEKVDFMDLLPSHLRKRFEDARQAS